MKKILIICMFLVFAMTACTVQQQQCENVTNPVVTQHEAVSFNGLNESREATQDLVKFNNIDEVRQFLQERQVQQGASGSSALKISSIGLGRTGGAVQGAAVPDIDLEEAAVDGAYASGASDYSQTNVQYEAVDEADFVKNDDRYIYMVADNKLVIVDAYDVENADIIAEVDIGDGDDYESPQAHELFINSDTLVLFVQENVRTFYFRKYDIEPQTTYAQKTLVYIYNVSDRSDPVLKDVLEMSGRYYQSRMIGDIVYVVTQEDVYRNWYVVEPMIKDMSGGVIQPDIYYFDNPEDNYQYNTVTSIDLSTDKVVDAKTFMLGYSNTLMVSEDNIYIAYQKQKYWRPWYYDNLDYDSERFYDVVVPLLEGELKTEIQDIISQGLDESEEWDKISRVLTDFFERSRNNESMQNQYNDMFENIMDALEEYDTKKSLEDRETVIHRIAIDDGNIEYGAKGEIDGRLLNQFSMDEAGGYLRVASTVDIWNRQRIQYNNVYVLDMNIDVVGSLENVAPDERIYSTRFIGNKLYMVTFKQMDPFFVIDLSDPQEPTVLGALKIPGYSDYLHPYDENHIIGVGKETGENEWGGVSTTGIKVALFDVSDMNNPVEIDKVVIGDQDSDSAALHDHKAFLFSKEKNLLVLPITEVTKRDKITPHVYSNSIWYGAYVFYVDENGFDKLGTVEHSKSRSDYWSWWSASTVQRSLYMDDNLYTISQKFLKINDLADDLKELNSIRLPSKDNEPVYWI